MLTPRLAKCSRLTLSGRSVLACHRSRKVERPASVSVVASTIAGLTSYRFTSSAFFGETTIARSRRKPPSVK